MSLDTVDDLHAAEDEIGALRATLARVAAYARRRPSSLLPDDLATDVRRHAEGLFCRPSCGFESGECEAEDPSECGCPCLHGVEKVALDG